LSYIKEYEELVLGKMNSQDMIKEVAKASHIFAATSIFPKIFTDNNCTVLCEHSGKLCDEELRHYCELKLPRKVFFTSLWIDSKICRQDQMCCAPGKRRTRLKILESSGDIAVAQKACFELIDSEVTFIDIISSFCVFFVYHDHDGHPVDVVLPPPLTIIEPFKESLMPANPELLSYSSRPIHYSSSNSADDFETSDSDSSHSFRSPSTNGYIAERKTERSALSNMKMLMTSPPNDNPLVGSRDFATFGSVPSAQRAEKAFTEHHKGKDESYRSIMTPSIPQYTGSYRQRCSPGKGVITWKI